MWQHDLFDRWAPPDSPWSTWAKPVLFAELARCGRPDAVPFEVPSPAWLDQLPPAAAIVVDLPGPDAIAFGVALAWRGWRPVPLFNTSTNQGELVPMRRVFEALVAATDPLLEARVPPAAPPAFLLDAGRLRGRPTPGAFDNRWVVAPQDFPSGTFLRSRGVERVVVVRETGERPEDDLMRVLLRYEEAGLPLSILGRNTGELRSTTARHSLLGRLRLAWRVLTRGLRRNAAGGFGERVPTGSSGHG